MRYGLWGVTLLPLILVLLVFRPSQADDLPYHSYLPVVAREAGPLVPLPTQAPPATATATPSPTAASTETATSAPTSTTTATATTTPSATLTATSTSTSTHTATPSSTPTDTPTATATATPTNTPSATATACSGGAQVLYNTSFEDAWSPWVSLNGFPARTTLVATNGSYSLLLGGYDNALDLVGQAATIPMWAETAALYFDWYMYSQDSALRAYDWLDVDVTDATGQLLARGQVFNNGTRMTWFTTRLSIPGIAVRRGQSIYVWLRGTTDATKPTIWYLDRVRLYFACGTTIASDNP